jgi:hypothetical protein
MKPICENPENIEKIKNSNEYKGAVGEMEVVKNLKNLPDSYFCFNNVFLELDRYISFNKSKLKSAQIDHLVVGPTGVYVIETKNWSSEYVQKVFSENSYTPYDQIQRSSYLTYKYLNSLKCGNTLPKMDFNFAKNEIKVKSIIAINGADIPYIKGRHAYVVRTNELSSYIQKGSQTFSIEEVHEIAEKLIHRVNN